MRRLVLALAIAGCGGPAAAPPTLPHAPTEAPAHDLATAKQSAPHADPGTPNLGAKDPRVVDLDIIRITATTKGVGGEPELEHVATADLFKAANQAAKR